MCLLGTFVVHLSFAAPLPNINQFLK